MALQPREASEDRQAPDEHPHVETLSIPPYDDRDGQWYLLGLSGDNASLQFIEAYLTQELDNEWYRSIDLVNNGLSIDGIPEEHIDTVIDVFDRVIVSVEEVRIVGTIGGEEFGIEAWDGSVVTGEPLFG